MIAIKTIVIPTKISGESNEENRKGAWVRRVSDCKRESQVKKIN